MALQLDEDPKEERIDEQQLRIRVSPAQGRLGPRDETPPASCPVLCGPRSCATLPPNLAKQGQGSSEPKKRRLWGLRGLVKMFRRRTRRKGLDPSESQHLSIASLRTRSASELAVDQSINRCSGGPYNQGLGVSHDSVFSPESPQEEQRTSASSLALATRGVNMAELEAALRRGRTDDSGSPDDDLGLPQSPPTSPNAFDVSYHGFKNSSRATQSSCSDASLLSMGSSEYDEDSFGSLSHHSSRVSLIEGRNYSIDNEPAAGTVTLSHNAARHKMSVRPRRTHASSKMRKQPPMSSSSLPTTIEVNEEYMQKTGELVIREGNPVVNSSIENLNLASKDEFHARDAVEALVVELVTEKSKSYFARSFEEKRSSQVTLIDSRTSDNFPPSSIHVEDVPVGKYVAKERNKSDPTAFSKRINIGEGSRATVYSQRASSLEGLLGEAKSSDNYFMSRVLNNESHIELKPNLNSIIDIISPPIGSPQQTKNISPACSRDVDLGITVNSEQSCKVVLPKPVLSEEQTKKLLGSLNNRESRSSIDNLTTTLLPGIYIRPFSPGTNTEPTDGDDKMPVDSSYNVEIRPDDGDSDTRNAEGLSNDDLPASLSKPLEGGLPAESKLDEVKKVTRESSFTSQSEPKTGKVPEFMRVHLNRVKSLNSPVVLNTNNQQTPLEKDPDVCSAPPIVKEDTPPNSPTKPPIKDKPQEPVKASKMEPKEPTNIHAKEECTPAVLGSGSLSNDEQKPKEEIVLRRPSVLDKSAILDEDGCADGSNKKRSDQPELFKVFARRSFKFKENDSEDFKSAQDTVNLTSAASDVVETKKEEVKPQINAVKRYSIGSCPVPFGSRFADTNITQIKNPPNDAHQSVSNHSPLAQRPTAAKPQPIVADNSPKISPPKNETPTQSSIAANSTPAEGDAPSKIAFSRRSFSHVALKQPKCGLGRTSSANQSDYSGNSVIINRCVASNAEKTKETEEVKDVRTSDVKPPITTKPIVWPPVKSSPDSPPKNSPVEVVSKPQPVAVSDKIKFCPTESAKKPDSARQSEGKENAINNSKLLNRFNSEAPRKVSLAEARNTNFAQSLIVEKARKDSLNAKIEASQKPASYDEPAGDWRVLVRQRREDRLKHTKSMDADEIIMETRPNSNRSSKVLEMANNFQKLQVA